MRFEKYITVAALAALTIVVGCGSDRAPVNGDTETESGSDPNPVEYNYDPSVPQDCDEVEQDTDSAASTVGCTFYSTSMDSATNSAGFGLVLANVNFEETAVVTIKGSFWDNDSYYVTNEGEWRTIVEDLRIAPLKQKRIEEQIAYEVETDTDSETELVTHKYSLLILLNQFAKQYFGSENPKGMIKQGAYQITSSVPITAYQFNPLQSGGTLVAASDASMLIPVSSWAEEYQVVGYRSTSTTTAGNLRYNTIQMELAYFAVVAHEDDTVVTIDPSVKTRISWEAWLGDDVYIEETDQPFQKTLNSSDVMFVHAADLGASLSGTRVSSSDGKKIGVFTGHQCANVPEYAGYCDNLEEQIPGVKYWGRKFIASRFPNRNRVSYSDPVLWQIHASADNTELTFAAEEGVKGLPEGPVVLNKGEVAEYMVYGGVIHPGDFAMNATEPVAVLQYMTGSTLTTNEYGQSTGMGDPALAYVPPVDQFVGRYIVNIPDGWNHDYMVVTREAGVSVLLDGVEIDDELFKAVPVIDENDDRAFEVARIPTKDGARTLESADLQKGIGLVVVGYDDGNSYAYTGGMGFKDLTQVQ